MAFHVTLADGTTKQFDAEGDSYIITAAGVLEIASTLEDRQVRLHYSPSGWTSVVEVAEKPGKKPKRALILR